MKDFNEFLDIVTKLGVKICGDEEHFRKWLYTYNIRLEEYPINLVESVENLEKVKEELELVQERKAIEYKTYL